MSNRHGFSLAELIVGLVVASLVSASIIQLMVVQSRFMTTQEGRANARAVSRGAIALVESDLRMVQTSGGVIAAAADSITLRVPFAVGIICGHTGTGQTDIMLPPIDSTVLNEGLANLAGYGWRNSTNTLTWVESGSMTANIGSNAGNCTSGSDPITAIPYNADPPVIARVPQIAGGYRGAAAFLHQRVTYRFEASTAVPGRIGLYRRRARAGTSEEVVAPFDAGAAFRFFSVGDATSQAAPPANLNDLRGVELYLAGVNERAPAGSVAEVSPLRTAVFFKN